MAGVDHDGVLAGRGREGVSATLRRAGTLTAVPHDDVPSAFAAATAVTRAEGGGLVADLDPGWDVGGGILNGGYLLAVVARAAAVESPHPHPVARLGQLPAGHRPRAGDAHRHARARPGGRSRTARCSSATPPAPPWRCR